MATQKSIAECGACCLSCGSRIDGTPDFCPRCGAVLDWPDRGVPQPPCEQHMCRCWIAVAVLATALLVLVLVWLWLKIGGGISGA